MVITIIISIIFFSTYLALYYIDWPETRTRVPEIFLIVGSGFLSFGASESLATFITPVNMPGLDEHPYNFALNLPWIVLNAGALAFLFWRAHKKRATSGR